MTHSYKIVDDEPDGLQALLDATNLKAGQKELDALFDAVMDSYPVINAHLAEAEKQDRIRAACEAATLAAGRGC